MKRKYQIHTRDKTIEREYSYIPVRYIIAAIITLLEIAAIIGIMIALCIYVTKFYILCYDRHDQPRLPQPCASL